MCFLTKLCELRNSWNPKHNAIETTRIDRIRSGSSNTSPSIFLSLLLFLGGGVLHLRLGLTTIALPLLIFIFELNSLESKKVILIDALQNSFNCFNVLFSTLLRRRFKARFPIGREEKRSKLHTEVKSENIRKKVVEGYE